MLPSNVSKLSTWKGVCNFGHVYIGFMLVPQETTESKQYLHAVFAISVHSSVEGRFESGVYVSFLDTEHV